MRNRAVVQRRLDVAFDNYLKLTDVLRSDLQEMLTAETNTPQWRRNFIRAAAALLEGHTYCLRQMCRMALQCTAPAITSKERRAILDENAFDANTRIMLILRAAYKLHSLGPLPRFDDTNWKNAQRVILKRHRLMHPRRPSDLGLADTTWRLHKKGIIWLAEQFFGFLALLQAKHGS